MSVNMKRLRMSQSSHRATVTEWAARNFTRQTLAHHVGLPLYRRIRDWQQVARSLSIYDCVLLLHNNDSFLFVPRSGERATPVAR